MATKRKRRARGTRTRLLRAAAGAAAVAAAATAVLRASPLHAALIIDVRAISGTGGTVVADPGNVYFTGAGDSFTMGLFARVNGTNGQHDETLQQCYGSINSAGTTLLGDLAGGVVAPFNNSGFQNGSVQDWDSDGDVDVGSLGTSATGKFYARGGSLILLPATGGANAGEIQIGQFTFTFTGGVGDAFVQFVPPRTSAGAPVSSAALWQEDANNSPTPLNPVTGTYAAGTSVHVLVNPKFWLASSGANWDNAANWSSSGKPSGTHLAYFPSPIPSGGGTITLSAGENASLLKLDASYSLTGGSLSIASGIIDVSSGATATIASALTGGAGLSKIGPGTLVLSSTANSYAGATTIKAGILSVSADTNLGAAGNALAMTGSTLLSTATFATSRGITLTGGIGIGGTFNVASATTLSVNGQITGSGALYKSGGGMMMLNSASNNYSGWTTVTAGTLALGANNVLPSGADVIVDGGTLDIGATSNTVSNVDLKDGLITGTTGVINASSLYSVTNGTISARLGGAVGLFVGVGGTVTLSGVNTYTGGTGLDGGVLKVAADNNLGAASGGVTFDGGTLSTTAGFSTGRSVTFGSSSFSTGGTFEVASGTTLTLSGVIDGGTGKTFSKTDAGVLAVTGVSNTYTAATLVSGGLLSFAAAGSYGSTPSILVNAGGAVGLSSSSLNAAFLGKMQAAPSNSSGGLALSASDAAAGVNFTAAPLNNAKTVGMSVGAIGTVTFTGTITPDATLGYRLGGGGTLRLANTNALTGARNVTIANGGTVVLPAVNNYTGSTTVDVGTMQLVSGGSASGTTLAVNSGGVLDLAGGSFSPTGNVTIAGGTLQIDNSAATFGWSTGKTMTVSGGGRFSVTTDTADYTTPSGATINVSGTGSQVVHVDAGVTGKRLLFSGSTSTFSGGAALNADGLFVTSGGSLTVTGGGSSMNVTNGLQVGGGGLLGTFTLSSGATASLNGFSATTVTSANSQSDVNILTGAQLTTGGIVRLGNQSVSGQTATVDVNGTGSSFTITGSFTATIGASSTSSIVLTLATGGTFTTGTGTTSINPTATINVNSGGKFVLQGTTTNAGTLNIAAGGTLQIGNGATTGSISGNLASSGTILFDRASNITYSGNISGSGAVSQIGTGTLRLNGSNSYTGTTSVNAGTLLADTTAALPGFNVAAKVSAAAGATLAVSAGGAGQWSAANIDTLRANSIFGPGSSLGINVDTANTFSYSSAVSGALGLTKLGAGQLTLTAAASSYAGATTVADGKMSVAGNLTGTASIAVSGGTLELARGGGSNRVIKTAAVATSGAGRIDLQDNKLIVTGSAVGTWNGSAYSGVTALVANGYGPNQDFSGSGIVTSQSNATGGNTLTCVGVASNADIGYATFGGVSVGANDTLVMYTYGGDANLDGAINGDDYFQIDSGFPEGSHGWFSGDFNYDGAITGDDYFVIDSNFPAQGAPYPTGAGLPGVRAVPEPANLAVCAAAAAASLILRRRAGPRIR